MYDVFLSYAKTEATRVSPLKAALEAEGYKVFFDQSGIEGGEEWTEVIEKAVKDERTVVVGVWTHASLKRPWVIKECSVGYRRKKFVPVAFDQLGELEPPTEFISTQYLQMSDFADATHPKFRELILRIDQLLGRTENVDSESQPLPTKSNSGDVRYALNLEFEESVLGTERRFKLGERSLYMKVRPGASAGQQLRFEGYGGASGHGPGDAIFVVQVGSHQLFRRDGDDVLIDVPISLFEAVAGARVAVPTIHGFKTVDVPANSNTGDVLKLPGYGVKDKGDQKCRLLVTLPSGENAALIDLLRAWPSLHKLPMRPLPPDPELVAVSKD